MKKKNPAAITIRALARDLDLSPTTVSESLRGVARVAGKTAARVRAAAGQARYRYNPLVGAVMSQVRRSGTRGFRGILGLLDFAETYRPAGADQFHAGLTAGIEQRCHKLGYALDRFMLGGDGLSVVRLNGVLAARNIFGVLILPVFSEFDLGSLDWSRFSGIYLDRVIQHPPLHCVGPDHFDAVWMALEELSARGYRRPGLVLQRRQDQRLRHRWEAGFLTYCAQDSGMNPAPILVVPEVTEEIFVEWFRQAQPDVVLGHDSHYIDWIRRAGLRVPQTTGFVALNLACITVPCASVDLQPYQIGALASELLVGQILRGDLGIPESPSHTSPPARWVDGPTVRRRER